MILRTGSLFTGIGGLDLGVELSGIARVVWQVEIDDFCRRVLAKHWPRVTRYDDVTRPRNYAPVDLIIGGFPCQDLSSAGEQRGLGGERSSLWWHFADIVRKLRPAFVLVENVASGAGRWLHHVRHTLHLLGYRTRAYALSAADVGAPHLRRRVFVVADSDARLGGEGDAVLEADAQAWSVCDPREAERDAAHWQDADRDRRRVDDGLPRGLDERVRLEGLGNAVVPHCGWAMGNVIAEMVTARLRDVRRPETATGGDR